MSKGELVSVIHIVSIHSNENNKTQGQGVAYPIHLLQLLIVKPNLTEGREVKVGVVESDTEGSNEYHVVNYYFFICIQVTSV